jgi:hypothetical protein
MPISGKPEIGGPGMTLWRHGFLTRRRQRVCGSPDENLLSVESGTHMSSLGPICDADPTPAVE